jgi:formylglycine-generating enzyme required for sulfatase activity
LTSLAADSYNPAMNDDKMITQQDIDEASVRLKPVLGVLPRVYVAAAYGAILLALAFLLLLYPGLRRPGITYSLTVDPPGAAVLVDGAYKGYAPCDVFLEAGDRSVRVERPGFASFERTLTVRGRAFGTLIAKPRAALSVSLAQDSASRTIDDGFRSYASWALAGTPSEAYQIPMVLSDAARAAAIEPGADAPAGLAGAAMAKAAHAQSQRDAVRAVSIAYGASAAVTPASLGRLTSALSAEIRSDPAILAALSAAAPASARARLEASALYRGLLEDTAAAATLAKPSAGASAYVGGQEFVALASGAAVIRAGAALDAVVPVASFRLAATETTVGDFRRFVAARPAWGPASAADLVARGLAEEDYLRGFDAADDAEALRFVSRPAALAYCAWLSESAPAGYRYALPTEAQWAYAAAVSGASASRGAALLDSGVSGPVKPAALAYDAAGLKGMLGNVWEWCADSFSANPAAGRSGLDRFRTPDAVVRGGSWANRSDLVNLSSRGPMRESACTAYLGFRVALAAAGD